MANLIRPAKPVNDWTEYDLAAYNIKIVSQTKQEFFGSADLPAPVYSLAGFISTEVREDAMDNETYKLLRYLDLALDPQVGQEAAVLNFAAKLLEKLGYGNVDNGIIFIRRALPLVVCGVPFIAQTDVCAMDNNNEVLFLLQEGNRLQDPEPQLVATAIAAYAANKKIRASLNLPPRAFLTFPAITMIGTNPIFYQIMVTDVLSTAVQQGTYPTIETFVFRYTPVLPRHSLGMRPLENRVEILGCLDAFKKFVGEGY